MQELTFEQVGIVAGAGYNQGPFIVQDFTNLFNTLNSNSHSKMPECYDIPGESLSPAAQGLLGAISAAASRFNVGVGVAVATLAAYFNAYVQQDQTVCPTTPLTQEEITNIINRGLTTGGPL